jgi:sugar lactone lactonase YvrE
MKFASLFTDLPSFTLASQPTKCTAQARFQFAVARVVALLVLSSAALFAVGQTAHFDDAQISIASQGTNILAIAVDAKGDVYFTAQNPFSQLASQGRRGVQYVPAALHSQGTRHFSDGSNSTAAWKMNASECTYQGAGVDLFVRLANSSTVSPVAGLNAPYGLALDSSGDLYVLDAYTGGIYEYAAQNGTAVLTAAPSFVANAQGDNCFGGDMAMDALGDLYYTSPASNEVEEIVAVNGVIPPSPSSRSLGSGYDLPVGVAVDSIGDVYVASAENNAVDELLAVNGSIPASPTIRTLGSGFNMPAALAVDSRGDVYVSDFNNNVLKEILAVNGSIPSSPTIEDLGSLSETEAVTLDGSGDIFAGDSVNNGGNVIELTPGGAIFGQSNIGTAVPAISMAFTFDSTGSLGGISVRTQGAAGLDYANTGSGTCNTKTVYSAGQTCTVNVSFTPQFSGSRDGAVVLTASNGNVIATGYAQGTGVGPQVNFLPGAQSTVLATGISDPTGVAVDGSGNVYLVDTGNSRVVKETLSSGAYSESTVSSDLALPYGVAVDGSGSIYIADTGNNRVLKETPTASGYSESIIASGVGFPSGVAVDASGNVYVTDDSNGLIVKETLSAGSYAPTTIVSGLSSPAGVAVDGSGNVYIADTDNDRVLKETLSGGIYTESILPSSGLVAPTGIAVDGAGNVYIVFESEFLVLKETLSTGSYTPSILVSGLNSSIGPFGVAVDSSDNLYVGDEGNNQVLKEDFADPPSLTFAATAAGSISSDSPQTITAENVGNAALNFSGVSFPPSFPENSQATTDCTAATSLSANQTCTLTTDFSPLAMGTIAQSLVLTDNTLNQSPATQSISLNGTGAPALSFTLGASPNSLTVVQGGASSELTIAINDVSGFAGNVTLAASGLPNGVTASFSPNPTAGTSVLTLTASSGTSLGSATVTITGTSGSLTASISFVLTVIPVEPIGTQSPAIPVTLTFNAAGTLSSTAVLTQGATGLDFANAGAGTCTVNTAYSAGQTCTVNVTFTPRFAGIREGAIVLEDGSGNVLATSYLESTGMGPQINFLPNTESVVANASVGLLAPYAMAVDGSGNLYIADVGANAVFKETLSAGIYNESLLPTSSLNQPTGIAVDGGGNVYISDTNNSRVLKESPFAGGYAESVVANSTNNGINFPIDLAVDGNGSVYFFCSSTLYIEAPSAGGYIQGTVPYSGISSPGGLAADGSGNLYIVDFGDNQVVKEAPVNGGYIQTTVPTSGLNQPSGIAVDGMGNIYVADIGGGPIFKETLVAGSYIQSTIATSSLNEPLAVAADQAGNVYIGDAGSALVLKEDFADAPSLAFASTASGAISSDSPQTVTVENAGNLVLNFPIPSMGSNPSISTNFTLNSTVSNACPLVKSGSSTMGALAAGASCQLPISFAPTAIGTFSGLLALTDNNLNAASPGYAVQTVALSGTGTQIAPMITWATPSPITYGTALSKAQLNAKSSVAGSFSYSPAVGTVLGAGQQTLTVTFTPTNTTEYATTTATVTLIVNQATPTITWATPKAITYGTALSGTQLDASTKVAGTFAYSPASGTVLNAGVQVLTATFTPTDAVDYSTATAMVMLTVNKATLTVIWPTPAAISYGTALTGTQLDATSTAPGTFVYSPAAGTVLSVGSHTLTVTLTPTSPANYTTSTATAKVTLTVNKAIPQITWATPAGITYGTALSATQLNASSTVAGTFTYSPATGTVLNAGSQTLSVTFTPFNSADYATGTGSVILTVSKATPAITWSTPKAITYGTALSATQLDASSTVAGIFTYSPAAGTVLAVGSQALSVTFTPFNATDYTTATGSAILTVKKAMPAITWATPKAITYGTALSATQLDASSIVSGTFAYSPAAGTVLAVGSQTLSVAFTPSNIIDYTTTSGSVVLTVNKATPAVTLTSSASSIVSGTSVTFTAGVTGSGAEPTGSVTFFDGTKQIGLGTLNSSGVATFATSTLAVGKQSITASYGGNTNYLSANSSAIIIKVSAP